MMDRVRLSDRRIIIPHNRGQVNRLARVVEAPMSVVNRYIGNDYLFIITDSCVFVKSSFQCLITPATMKQLVMR